MAPQGEGIRVSPAATPGGSITIHVGSNDDTVEVSPTGSTDTTTYPVPPNKEVTVPVPDVPPGTTLVVRVGKGPRRRRVVVVVVAPTP